ncbi:hypothetical protein ACFOGG_05035 [Brenneria rubrifaciens]|uniref:hypothetical protein n=1 Tax=Brenneria rubrifaciens TaxID=55213 RepID=UPI00360E0813
MISRARLYFINSTGLRAGIFLINRNALLIRLKESIRNGGRTILTLILPPEKGWMA